MTRHRRSDDWGFPRWRAYGKSREATELRACDRDGCSLPGDRPAPKAPNSAERWYFCEAHAGEYNRNWDYFAGLDSEAAAARAADEGAAASAYARSGHWQWGGPGDGSRSRDEMRALEALELDSDAGFDLVKAAYRRLAKANHPDLRPGDLEAAQRFREIQAAYQLLRRSEEQRLASRPPR